jgi:hypothetical protein
MHFCIKKEDDLCLLLSWNKTTMHKKIEWKFITCKTIASEISKGNTFKPQPWLSNFVSTNQIILSFMIQDDFTFFS